MNEVTTGTAIRDVHTILMSHSLWSCLRFGDDATIEWVLHHGSRRLLRRYVESDTTNLLDFDFIGGDIHRPGVSETHSRHNLVRNTPSS